jgi:gliding motility-associated-like protein
MYKKLIFIFLLVFSFSAVSYSQQIIDSCFSSATVGTSFTSSTNLVSLNGDLMQWNGSSWSGGWPGANITIPPPAGGSGCRAIWCGSGSVWTTGGEGFAAQLNAPLVAGQSYTFNFTTVSHGTGSNGSFSPRFSTNSSSALGSSTFVGNLTPAGNSWVTNAFTFTATAGQAGHTWIFIHSGAAGSSGFVNNLCVSCNVPQTVPCSVNLGPDQNLCPGQTTILNATTAGATYSWQNGSTAPTFTVTQAGTYSVTINVGGCIATDAVTVNYGVNPTVNLGNDVTLCPGQTLNLNATFPNSTYLWQNNSTAPTFTVTQAGTYSVAVTNSCGTVSDNIVVSYNALPVIDLGPNQTLCTGETLVLDATSPSSTYLWQNNSTAPTFTVTLAGTYSVAVTNSCGTVNDNVVVNYTPLPVIDLGPDQTICSGESVILNATTSGGTYLWQDNSTNATIVATTSGTYSVDVNTSCGIISDAVVITVIALPQVDLGSDTTLCDGQTLLLDVTTSGASYLWQDNSTNSIFTVDQAGTYSVEVTSGLCSGSDQITVDYIAAPSLNLGNDTLICEGESIVLDATTPGVSYLWQDNSILPTFTVLSSGIYSLEITSSCGVLTDEIQVGVVPLPIVNLGNDTAFCQGGTLVLDVTNANCTYLWQDNSTNSTFTVTETGSYSVTVSNLLGCETSDVIDVVVDVVPTVSAGLDQNVCQGESVTLSGSGATTYSWSNGVTNGVPFIPAAGTVTYTLTGTTAGGCVDTDEVVVTVGNSPNISFVADITSGCIPLTVQLTNTTPNATSCVWTLSDGTLISGCGTVEVVFEQGGCFDVTLTTELASGCYGSYTAIDYICAEDAPIASFIAVPQQVFAMDPNVQFNNTSVGAETYLWDFGDNSDLSTETHPEHTYPFDEPGSYSVMLIASTPSGCVDTAYSYVEVLEDLIYYVPNSFTPDGDIYNQTFDPVFTSGFDPYDYNFKIFNRWGELIFESNDPELGWDGSYTLNGQVFSCHTGVYTWKIEFKAKNNDERTIISGHVSLLR